MKKLLNVKAKNVTCRSTTVSRRARYCRSVEKSILNLGCDA